MICRKSMMACQTPGMCSPHGGCPATEQVSSAWLAQLRAEHLGFAEENKALKAQVQRLADDSHRNCNYFADQVERTDQLKAEISRIEPCFDDVQALVGALGWLGYSTPEGGEECAARWLELVRALISAAAKSKMLRMDADYLTELDTYKAENERLRVLLAEKVVNATMLTGLVAIDGGIALGFEGGACGMMAQLFGDQFFESPAINYLELRFNSTKHPDLGRLVVTLQRVEGKTPAEMRATAETQASALAFLLQYIVDNEHNHDENQNERSMVITDAESLLAHLSGAIEAHTLIPDAELARICGKAEP